MPQNFYKYDGSYYLADTHNKILNPDELQAFSKAGGKEVQYAPDPSWLKIAGPSDIPKYNVKGQFGSTLYGTLKEPDVSHKLSAGDIGAGAKFGEVTPPETTASLVRETFAKNAKDFSASAKAINPIFEQQIKEAQTARTEAQKAIDDLNKRREEEVIDDYDELSRPYRATMEEAGNAEFQLKQKYQKYSQLAESLTVYAEQAYNDIQQEKNRNIPHIFKEIRTAKVKEDYNSKIALAQTAMAAVQGDISLGRTFIDRGIDAVTADRQDRLEFLKFLDGVITTDIGKAEDKFQIATKEEKDAIKSQIGLLEGEFKRIDEEKGIVREFLLNNAEIAIKADISLADNIDDMLIKVNNYYRQHPEAFEETKTYEFIKGDDKNPSGIFDKTTGNFLPIDTESEGQIATTLSIGSGTITGMDGSDKWKWGLDFVLAGGKGAEVKSPFIGQVIFAGQNAGFGNQVKILTADGHEIWLSHLEGVKVKKGDSVNDETIVGLQGNTGDVYSLDGGDGTHLDITIKKPDGTFFAPREVAALLGHQAPAGQTTPYEKNILVMRIGKQVYGTRISDAESERVQKVIDEGTGQGKDQYDMIDDLIGFKLDKNQELGANLRNILMQYTGDDGLASFDMLSLARLLNNDNTSEAVNKVEKIILARSEDGIEREVAAIYAQQKGDDMTKKISDNLNALGIVIGNWNSMRKKFLTDKNFQSIESGLTALVTEWRLKMAGSNVTETESKFLDGLIASVKDNPFNAMQKIKEFQSMNLNQVNAVRLNLNLPEIDELSLVDKKQRVGLYQDLNTNDPLEVMEGNGGEDSLGIL